MDIETLNPYVMKILISAKDRDSISSISKRISLSYGWTNKWVNELIKENIFKGTWRGVVLAYENKNYTRLIKFIKMMIGEVSFYYSFLKMSGFAYCLTNIDAVYVWTGGRYNIARYRDHYPIYVKIKKSEYAEFLSHVKRLKLKIRPSKGAFFVPIVQDEFDFVKKEGYNVDSLEKTIAFMKDHFYNFQPALEMIQDKYGKKLNVRYQEVKSF